MTAQLLFYFRKFQPDAGKRLVKWVENSTDRLHFGFGQRCAQWELLPQQADGLVDVMYK